MSYSRNFCALELNNTRDTLGHAYSNRQAIIQQKLLADPVNGIYYVDNEQPSEDTIFKINYPVGSIFTSQRPLVEYPGATRLTQDRYDNITYSFHGCIFRYVFSNYNASNSHTYLSTGRVLLNQENQLYYEAPEAGGASQSQFTLSGDNFVKGTQISWPQLPSHSHDLVTSETLSLAAGTDIVNVRLPVTYNSPYRVSSANSGGNQYHSHDFEATGTIDVNPPRLPIFMYERIQ